MKKGILIGLFICFIFIIGTLSVFAESQNKFTGNLNLILGVKFLDESQWSPTDLQGESGFHLDFKFTNWPISIVAEYLFGAGAGTVVFFDVESETTEFNVGIQKNWDHFPHLRLSLGGGLSVISGKLITTYNLFDIISGTEEVSDANQGYWLKAGIYWTIARHLNLGLELRFSDATIELYGIEVDAGGVHLNTFIGYAW